MGRRSGLLLVAVALAALVAGAGWLWAHPRSAFFAWVAAAVADPGGTLLPAFQPAPPLPRAAPAAAAMPPASPTPPPPPSPSRGRHRWIIGAPPLPDAHPQAWLLPGDRLLAAPSPDAAVVGESTVVANVPVLEANGEWRLVRWRKIEGWVRARPESGPPLGAAPEPVRPVAARPPAPARLQAARAGLRGGGRRLQVGPYPLYTDVEDASLLLLLDRAAAGLDMAYRERYGLAPLGEPAEAVVLFRERAAYQAFLARAGGPSGESGHVAEGVVALYREGRRLGDVRASLVHELVHLLARRALGPALPPWLDEGMADDLAESQVGEGGRLLPGTLSDDTTRAGEVFQRHGGAAARDLVQSALGAGRLVPVGALVTLDADAFQALSPRALGYAESSFLVRFLLGSDLAPRFRAFLAAVAAGTPPTAEALAASLGLSLDELDARFRAWVASPG